MSDGTRNLRCFSGCDGFCMTMHDQFPLENKYRRGARRAVTGILFVVFDVLCFLNLLDALPPARVLENLCFFGVRLGARRPASTEISSPDLGSDVKTRSWKSALYNHTFQTSFDSCGLPF